MKLSLLCLLLISGFSRAQYADQPAIIPMPLSFANADENFILNENTGLVMVGAEAFPIIGYLNVYIQSQFAIKLKPATVASPNTIELYITDVNPDPEGYMMTMTKNKIQITGSAAGIFYGVQSLIQLMIQAPDAKVISIPCFNIVDEPRFKWRGMHLDCSRHFFSVSEIKKYLDIMAHYKLNTFHWHLTDDQGWRIEIKKYPLLTQIGSMRKETMTDKNFNPYVGDGIPVSGFYTQEEIKDIISFAKERFITIVPEIEMPGHCLAALASYPEYCDCHIDSFSVMTKWGVSMNVFSPTQKTFSFLEDILTEVMDLFPSEYIHIGGDEVPKDCWKISPLAQQVMKDNKLKDPEALQSFFIKTIEKFISSKGRKMIGWDEILEGGLAPRATVMSWRGESGGITAAQQGHDVVMSPGSTCYFDHAQSKSDQEPLNIGGFLPLEKVYSYDPVPESLTDEQKKFILGAQANLWTEYIPTNEQLEYMLLPRMLALSEMVWTPLAKKDFSSFKNRIGVHFTWLNKQGYNYRIPEPEFFPASVSGIKDSVITITLADIDPGVKIYYTIDGSIPDISSTLYVAPLKLILNKTIPVTVTAIAYLDEKRKSIPVKSIYSRLPTK